MKSLFITILLLLSFRVMADASTDYTASVDLDTANKQVLKPYVRALLDADSTTLDASEVIDLNAYLPEGAVVTKTYMKIINANVSANNNTIAVGCNGSTNDLFSAFDYSVMSSDDLVAGAVTGASTTDMVKVGAGGCHIRAVIGAGASGVTAGRNVFFFEYVVGE